MIIVNLKGGLGNQMFQYALGRKLSIQNNDSLKFDISDLDKSKTEKRGDTYRPYALGAFNVQGSIASSEEIQRLKYPLGTISKMTAIFRRKILKETHEDWEPTILKKKGDMYLDGFWQSPKYFEDIRSTILSDFSLKTPFSSAAEAIAAEIANSNSVSLHVRRGDYVSDQKTNTTHGVCSTEYYIKAVEKISAKHPNPTFFVFSDDIEWVKSNLPLPASTVFVSGLDSVTDAQELILMSLCKHNIVANSSFSWWAAWLNENPHKTVIAPRQWVAHKPKPDIIPSTWIQIENL